MGGRASPPRERLVTVAVGARFNTYPMILIDSRSLSAAGPRGLQLTGRIFIICPIYKCG
jgi:hypothetical protein